MFVILFKTSLFQLALFSRCDVCVCSVTWSCPTLCGPLDCSHQASVSMGFCRQECWSGLPFPTSGDCPNAETEPRSLMSPASAGGFFSTGKPCTRIMCPFSWLARVLVIFSCGYYSERAASLLPQPPPQSLVTTPGVPSRPPGLAQAGMPRGVQGSILAPKDSEHISLLSLTLGHRKAGQQLHLHAVCPAFPRAVWVSQPSAGGQHGLPTKTPHPPSWLL